MGTTAVIYRIILLGHIAAAIVGFGGLIAHGTFHAQAVRSDPRSARSLLSTTVAVSRWANNSLYAVFALGIVLIALSDDVYGYGELWVSAAFLAWFVIVGLNHGLVRPARSRLIELADALASESVETETTALADHEPARPSLARLALGEGLTQVLLVVSLALMIWKPGQ